MREVLEPAKAGELIRDRPIRLQLALALDAWAEARRYTQLAPVPAPSQGKSWEQLLATASVADPEPWRIRLRGVLQKRNREALMEVANAGPLDDVPPLTLGLLGRALSDCGAQEQAETLLRRAQRRSPTSFWLNYDLAMILGRKQPPRPDEALRFFSVAQALRPDSPAVHAMLCRTLSNMGAWEETAAQCQEAIRLKAAPALVHTIFATALRRQGRLDEAIAEHRKALALEPDHLHAHNNLAWLLSTCAQPKFRDAKQALELAKRAVELAPEDGSHWNTLGVAQYRAGDWKRCPCVEEIRWVAQGQ